MKMLALKQKGFAHVELLIIAVVIAVVGFAAYKVTKSNHDQDTSGQNSRPENKDKNGPLVWSYDEAGLEWYVKSGTAPSCKDPLKFDMSPVDISNVSAVGLPGAYRGFNYKAHGGFRAVESTNGELEVKMPIDAKLRNITRYYEKIPGHEYELQYLVTFENDCGIAFRFDHLHTLSPDFQALAEKTPEPKRDDTRSGSDTQSFDVTFRAGDVVATKVGFPSAKNFGFDFGVYDYRTRNVISSNATWAEIHKQFASTEFHGICWTPLLPEDDAIKAEAMAKDRSNYNTNKPFHLSSDYCDFAPYKTLDFNGGQPTDG